MEAKPHENVRIAVVGKLRNILLDILREIRRAEESSKRAAEARALEDLLESSPDLLPLLLPQEVGKGEYIDMTFRGRVLIELKGDQREFKQAVRKAESLYMPKFEKARYYVLTDGRLFCLYEVQRGRGGPKLRLLVEGEENRVLPSLKRILAGNWEWLGVFPTPENIRRLFSLDRKAVEALRGAFEEGKENKRIQPLYKAYKELISKLYSGTGEGATQDLFLRHTLMHMIVLACLSSLLGKEGDPTDLCSGTLLDTDIALPYLNWWRYAEGDERLRELVSDISVRSGLIDWEFGAQEDVFRELYEVLVEPEIRRRIGEYYTPVWLCELLLREFDLREKLVLDPFCGSGTFLVTAFHKKVQEGEDPEQAYDEVIGLDINPLAVSVARAELLIAFRGRTGRLPDRPPHVYHADTIAMLAGPYIRGGFPEYFDIVRSMYDYLCAAFFRTGQAGREIAQLPPSGLLASLSRIERTLFESIKLAEKSGGSEGALRSELEERSGGGEMGPIEAAFDGLVRESTFVPELSELVRVHGDGVWAPILLSAFVPAVLEHFRPHIIVTNPPWVPLTEYRADYMKTIRERVLNICKRRFPEKAEQIVMGSDLSIYLLLRCMELAREGVGFVMSREQTYHHRAPSGVGILLTYAVWAEKGESVKLIDIDADAFEHGMYPALVVAKKGEKRVELWRLLLEQTPNKSSRLGKVSLKEERVNQSYEEYLKPALRWAASKGMEDLLEVEKVIPKGEYIMGLMGGEKKKGKEEYAGLVLEGFEKGPWGVKFRLWNLSKDLKVSASSLSKYKIRVYRLAYVGLINPFSPAGFYPVLLSAKGEKELKGFLQEAQSLNEQSLPQRDLEKLRKLIKEAKQPKPKPLQKEKWHVIYRCDRAFTAYATRPHNLLLDSHASAITCKTQEQAHYYAAVLNYLAFKVTERGRTFIRHQFAKPLDAIIYAGLSWKDTNEEKRTKISSLGKRLARSPPCKGRCSNQAKALKALAGIPEFQELVRELDSMVDKERLEEALDFVSGRKEKRSKRRKTAKPATERTAHAEAQPGESPESAGWRGTS